MSLILLMTEPLGSSQPKEARHVAAEIASSDCFRPFACYPWYTSGRGLPVAAQSSDGMSLYQQAVAIANSQGPDAAAQWVQSLPMDEQNAIETAQNQDVASAETGANLALASTGRPLAPSQVVAESDGSISINASALADGCYGPYVAYQYKKSSITGTYFWQYNQSIQWCVQNGWINGAWCSAWSSNTGGGWYFSNHLTYCAVTYGGVGWNVIKYFSQGSFCAGFKWTCVFNDTPWVAQQGENSGNYFTWYS